MTKVTSQLGYFEKKGEYMSVSNSYPTFKYNFTDGTFMTVLNVSGNAPVFDGEITYILPNYYFGDLENFSGTITKYDKNGNKFEFSNQGVIVNDTQDLRRTGNRMAFVYNPDTDTLGVSYFYPPPELIPNLSQNDRSVSGYCFNHNTSGTPYSSLGDAIAKGEDFYDRLEYGWYSICNILPRTGGSPFHTANLFWGSRNNTPLQNAFTGSSTTSSVNINYDGTMENFDPITPLIPDDDPFNPGGDSESGGGTGDFDGTGDDIDIPSLPTVSANDTGFITLFNPSITQLKNLASYMWSGLFDLNTYRKLFADPMDCILGLSIVPVAVPNGSSKEVKVGNISTGVSMTTASTQYVEVDCGSLNVNEYWGAYLDYDPYTKAEIYLPYIGTHPIAVDDIMKKNVAVKYHVDILSGACTAYVKCGGSVLYTFIGQCSSSIPITANDWTNVINGVLSIAGSIGTMVATGGLSAPISTGSLMGAAAAAGPIASTAINTMKPSVEKSGSMSGTGGMLSIQTPYLILTRPRQALPSSQNAFMGYPSFITEYLGGLSGYTEIEAIHLDGISATDAEIQELETLLYKGVIF